MGLYMINRWSVGESITQYLIAKLNPIYLNFASPGLIKLQPNETWR